jgi:hypothetical protein
MRRPKIEIPPLEVTVEQLREARIKMQAILESVAALRNLLPPLRFTADGHLVGSYGEAWAVWLFGLVHKPGKIHDAYKGNLGVQIKATFGNRAVGLTISDAPEHLLVLSLDERATPSVIYNGPGLLPWTRAVGSPNASQRVIQLSRLKLLHVALPEDQRLPLIHQPSEVADGGGL